MTKLSTLARVASAMSPALLLAALTRRHGGLRQQLRRSDVPPPAAATHPPPAAPIEGIATPSSVAVVTATNAAITAFGRSS